MGDFDHLKKDIVASVMVSGEGYCCCMLLCQQSQMLNGSHQFKTELWRNFLKNEHLVKFLLMV